MFKMKLKVNFKDILTTVNSKEITDEITLTDSEKKSINSRLGRIKRNTELLEVVSNKGLATYKEFIKALHQHNSDLAAKIENTKESDYQEELEEELEKSYNPKIPENIRHFYDSQIQDWLWNDEMIVETNASIDVFKRIHKSNCVVLVGRQSSGKSSLLRHVALKLVKESETEDFDIIPVVIEPSTVIDYCNEKRNQIFLLDDFCGKDKVNSQILDVWKLHFEQILKVINQSDCYEYDLPKIENRKTKILISCSTSVYDSTIFEPLKKCLNTFICELSKFPLTSEERETMIQKYSPDAKEPVFMQKGKSFDYPLLCKLSKGKRMNEIHRLFLNPIEAITDDLTKLQKDGSLQFCAIALCTLFKNKFKENWLNLSCDSEDNCKRNAVSEMCLEFNLDLTNTNDLKKIQNQFDIKQTNWISKSGDTFRLVHDEIFKIASVICGESYQQCFINHAQSSCIAQMFNFRDHLKGFITLNIKYQKIYFDRLFGDLENGISFSTFQNIQLKDKDYRKTFIEHCRKREQKFKEILENLKSNSVKQKPKSNNDNIKTGKKPLRRQDTFLNSNSPLIECAFQGYEDMVDLLLKISCDVNEKNTLGKSALCVAAEKGHIGIVQRLIENEENERNVETGVNKKKNAIIDLCNNKKRTPLHMACEEGHEEVVKYLIRKGANISARDIDDYTPVHMACASGKTKILKILLSKKIDEKNKFDNSGQTPIIIASSHGENEVITYLLQIDPQQVHDTDKKGFTPLLAACMNGFEKTVELLITGNPDIFHLDNDMRSALFIACEKGHTQIAKKLVEVGGKRIIELCDWHGKSPIYIACAEGREDIVKLLSSSDADINHSDEANKTPIYVACEKRNEEIVKFLLDKEAEINIWDIHNNLPLHVACKTGDLRIVKLLQEHKDCSNFKNKWEETALDIARKQGHKDIIIFLDPTIRN